jgi:hypothetical protein
MILKGEVDTYLIFISIVINEIEIKREGIPG